MYSDVQRHEFQSCRRWFLQAFLFIGKVMLTKVCTKCGVEKGVAEFYKHKSCKHGVNSECKVCCKKTNSDHYQANKDTMCEQKNAYYNANKDVIIKRNSAYLKANPHISNAKNAKRKAIKFKATPSWVDKEAVRGMYKLATIFNRTGLNLHVDHIVPLRSDTVCGLHCEANLQLLPASDNTSKGNRWWPDMW
jgi:hypothetical protein